MASRRPARRPKPRRQPEAEPDPDFESQRNDPLASLRLYSVDVVVGDQKFTIARQAAAVWFEAILLDDMSVLLDPADRFSFDEYVADGIDISESFHSAIEVISGRRWDVAVRLVALWLEDQVRGEVMAKVDIGTAPFSAVLDVTYATIVRNMDAKQRAEFENQLALSVSLVVDPRSEAEKMRELTRERAQASGKPSAATPPRTPRWPPTPRQDAEPDEPMPPPSPPPESDPVTPPDGGSTPR